MREFELSALADQDLLEIARYTIKTWGVNQAEQYEDALLEHFQAMARGDAWTSTPIERRPDLLCSRCQHHYVFALRRRDECLLILAVLHEKMDLMARLGERLEPREQA